MYGIRGVAKVKQILFILLIVFSILKTADAVESLQLLPTRVTVSKIEYTLTCPKGYVLQKAHQRGYVCHLLENNWVDVSTSGLRG